MSKIAMCVPTYKRADIINELFFLQKELYERFDIDLYIYDSSPDDETEKIVKAWMSLKPNIYYIRIPTEMSSNMKVYEIFKGYGLEKNYDYIWMRADYLRYSSNVLEAVCTDISSEVYDIIVTDWDDIYKIGNKKYNDQLTFFKDCCGCMTLYGSVIVKTDSMLSGVDWEKL
nr:glycosyltransferase [Lachnospiraceae bacterium]